MSPLEPPVGLDVETVRVPYEFVPNEAVVNALIDPVVIATPDIVPPVIATALAFCVDIVPSAPVALLTAVVTKAVVAICVVFVPEVAVGAIGVPVKVGDALNTVEPVPVEVVTPVPPLATGRVPVTPVVKGKPVHEVSVPLEGVPSAGVTNVGLVLNTTLPDPVEVVTPVPPLATGRVPETCVVKPILPQLGAVDTPPEIRALPVATSASLDKAVVVDA